MTPEQALARLLPEGWQSCAPFEAGSGRPRLTDRYRLRLVDDGFAVLRIDRPQARRLGLQRNREAAALRLAAPAGLAPELMAALPEEGVFLLRYLPGRAWGREDLQRAGALARVAALLRHVHALPPALPELDLAAAIRSYAEASGSDPRPALEALQRAQSFPAAAVPCHGDPNAANIIDDGARLRLIDWEYAGLCDPYFDLAVLLGHDGLAEGADDVLLEAYLGCETRAEERDRLEAWKACYRTVARLWEAAVGVAPRAL